MAARQHTPHLDSCSGRPETRRRVDQPQSDPRDREPTDEAPETPTDEPRPVPVDDPPVPDPNPVDDPPVPDPRAPYTVTHYIQH
jgi:hypothetical protein